MLDQDSLKALREKMPTSYGSKVQAKYQELFNKPVSLRTVTRFFSGTTYTTNMNKAVLEVIKDKEALSIETVQQVANG